MSSEHHRERLNSSCTRYLSIVTVPPGFNDFLPVIMFRVDVPSDARRYGIVIALRLAVRLVVVDLDFKSLDA